jgi:acetoin utilization protein AcuC
LTDIKHNCPLPAFVHSDALLTFGYGPNHPLQTERISVTNQLIAHYGLDLPAYDISPAGVEKMSWFHDPNYLTALADFAQNPDGDAYYRFGYGLGHADNPAFTGLWQWAQLVVGASLRAMELVVNDRRPAALALAGGMHHGLPGRASGFCYINDVGVIIKYLLKQGFKVAYVDIDAHHGDGVQWPFFSSDQVLTISIHQHPSTIFPGTGLAQEMGQGPGLGFAVNIPLWPDSDDEIYIRSFDLIVPPLLERFAPDYIITQLGADSLRGDPITNLNVTTAAYCHCVRRLKEMAWGRWIALGGGGYNLAATARSWTLAWAMMRGYDDFNPPLPMEFCQKFQLQPGRLRDQPVTLRGRQWLRAQEENRATLEFLQHSLFPLWGI